MTSGLPSRESLRSGAAKKKKDKVDQSPEDKILKENS